MSYSGTLISFEGGEGAGKTIQIKQLSDVLRKAGKQVLITREPGGTVISEQIREVILSPDNTSMAFTTEVLLFQAARAQVYRELILPSLQAGKTVLCDRSRDSSVVYQGMVRGFGKPLIDQLNDMSTQSTYPDITILLDVPVKLGLGRRAKTQKNDRIDMERKEFHEKVRAGYLKLAKQNDHKRWHIVDASLSIEQVHTAVVKVMKERGLIP